MTTPTSNPVPSNSPVDLLFNAEKLDEVVNETVPHYVDRFGKSRLTIQGATDTIKVITSRGAWSGPGTEYDSRDIVLVSGTWYIAVTAHTSSATFADDAENWRVYQGVMAQDLADSGGSDMVGYDGTTAQQILDYARTFANYSSLRAYAGRSLGARITGTDTAGQFYRDLSDTTTPDNGGTVIVDSLLRRWKRFYSDKVYVSWFDVLGTNSSLAIQRAIDALPLNGGDVYLPGGTLLLNSPITIGNGNGGAIYSTRRGVRLIGEGGGMADVPCTELQYTGASVSDYLIKILGRISGVQLRGIFIGLNGNIGGITARSFSGCLFEDLKIVNPRSNTNGFYVIGGGAPTGNYNIFNKWNRVFIGLLSPSSAGLYMDGDYTSNNDTWISTLEAVRVETVAGATNAACARFRFVDSISFKRCHFESSAEPTSIGCVFDATNNPGGGNDFPSGLAFYDCSIKNTSVLETGTQFIGKNYFYGHGVLDNEIPPDHPKLIGYTATGVAFGPVVGFNNKKTIDQAVTNTTALTTVYSYTAGSFFLGGAGTYDAADGILRVKHLAQYINNSGANANISIIVAFGGVTLFTIPYTAVPTGAAYRSMQLDFTLCLLNNSANNQTGQITAVMGAVGSAAGSPAAPFATIVGSSPGISVNTSTAQALTISVQHSVASSSIAYLQRNTLLEFF